MHTCNLVPGNELHTFGEMGYLECKSGLSTNTGKTSPASSPCASVYEKRQVSDQLKAARIWASFRSKVENPFWYIRQVIGYNRFSYRCLAKQYQSTPLVGRIQQSADRKKILSGIGCVGVFCAKSWEMG